MTTERSPRASLRTEFSVQTNDPDELEAAIKDRLAALADIEVRFEMDREGLERSVLPRALKTALLRQMRLRRRLRRLPHEIALNDLHRKVLLPRGPKKTLH
jgi:hypothetical protein